MCCACVARALAAQLLKGVAEAKIATDTTELPLLWLEVACMHDNVTENRRTNRMKLITW
jgi:hypothetical protein